MKNEKWQVRMLPILISLPCILGSAALLLAKAAHYCCDLILMRGGKNFMQVHAADAPETALIAFDNEQNGEEVDRWAKSVASREMRITSHDGLSLYALNCTQEPQSHSWAVVVHGYSGTGFEMNSIAKRFHDMGFNVLLPDCRGHGKSEGSYIGMGWHDRMDILGWVEKITSLDPKSNIVLYGLSMGAAAVLMASGEQLPKNIKCLIEDCGYTSVDDEFSYHLKENLHLPKFPLMNALDWLCSKKNGYHLKEASAIEQLKKCKIPILIIHGEMDRFVPTDMAYKLYNAAECPKEIFIVPNAGHGVSEAVSRQLYWERVSGFVNRAIKGENV
ncbi:MAG: alpha/beta hydrolase [Clostridiales bacterium]|jgi:fermentation-respiration switch protein FrsA (DUF1100 family)|nr:alpha/beta hydrolase [Clostridiales bacterium]